MKLDQLRKIIREEVKSAVKEELQDMLNEAVKAASTPDINDSKNKLRPVTQKDLSRTWSNGEINPGTVPLSEMINQTRSTMTGEEYRNVINATSDMAQKPNYASSVASNMGMTNNSGPVPGIDISKFDWAKKAGDIYKKSVENDKAKLNTV